jgi:hypothetical protein
MPLTLTRPSSISCSLARRDAIPAWDSIFCRRSINAQLSRHNAHDNIIEP